MELSFDDFYERHRPKNSSDLSFFTSTRVIKDVRKKFKNGKSFVLLSSNTGQGKHEIVRIVSTEFDDVVSLRDVYDDSTISNIEENDNVTFDMTGFLSTTTKTKTRRRRRRVVFLIDESVIRMSSCAKLLNAVLSSKNQCIFMCTSHNLKNERKINSFVRSKKFGVISVSRISLAQISKKIQIISQEYDVNFTRRASFNFARRIYSNLRLLWKLLYRMLDNAKKRNGESSVMSAHVFENINKHHTDGFDHFLDVRERCSDRQVYSLEERLKLSLGHSYALKHYCHRCVINEHCDPWNTKRKLDIHETARWTEVFSCSDHKGFVQEEEITLPLFLLVV